MTTHVTLTLTDFARRVRTLGPRMQRGIVRGLRAGAKRVRAAVAEAIAETRPYPPVDRGIYAASFQIERLQNGARVDTNVLHAQWMEIGRRPGPVPFLPILEWVKRKKLYERELSRVLGELKESHRLARSLLRGIVRGSAAERSEMNALRRRQRHDAIDIAARHVAWAIRTKIEHQGIAPRFPMRRALQHTQRDVELAILDAIDELAP